MILMPLNSVAAQGIAIISIRKKSNQIKLMMLIANEVNIGNTIQVINTKNLNNENITAMYTCRKHTSPIILRVSKSPIAGSMTATSYEITIQQLFQNVSDFCENVRVSKRIFAV